MIKAVRKTLKFLVNLFKFSFWLAFSFWASGLSILVSFTTFVYIGFTSNFVVQYVHPRLYFGLSLLFFLITLIPIGYKDTSVLYIRFFKFLYPKKRVPKVNKNLKFVHAVTPTANNIENARIQNYGYDKNNIPYLKKNKK